MNETQYEPTDEQTDVDGDDDQTTIGVDTPPTEGEPNDDSTTTEGTEPSAPDADDQ